MSGRPKETPTRFKTYKAYHESGRYEERLDKMLKKKQKIEMLETLIAMHEKVKPLDYEYVFDLYKRVNQVREQLRVLSTVDPYDFT